MLVLLVVKATLLVAAGGAVAAVLRRAPAGTRHLVWLATLVAVLALPLSLQLTPVRVAILPPMGTAAVALAQPPVVDTVIVPEAGPASAAMEGPRDSRDAVPLTAMPRMANATSLIAVVWAAVALALTAWLAAGVLAARRIVRSARPLDDPRWQGLLCEVADRLDLSTLPRLVSSDRVEVPFACGVVRATIVLPDAAAAWPDERRRLVLVHELAHVRRRDLLAHAVA